MISVGLTGGIGSGKTTVAKIWESMGAYVLYADELAKDLMVRRPDLKKKIIAAFGKEAYSKDGSLNRKYLAEEAFEKGRVEVLNNIVHPFVFKEAERIQASVRKQGFPVFVHESALLLKYGKPDNMDVVVIITAPAEIRIERVTHRDKSKPSDVAGRIKRQPDFSKISKSVDIFVDNSGTKKELEEKARFLFNKLSESLR